MSEPRVKVPEKVKKGEVFEIKTLISHPMETGQRKDGDGKVIPRMIINKLVCRYNGEEVFAAELAPAISANPYLSFFTQATASGRLEFAWTDDAGRTYTHTAQLTVE
ncbi:MAG: thiosulfate oxidation carrier complex protein SoxZ [Alphaproteobacteria bacterium]|nr:thiosulfate oxidation carrier complex protein SoxZ [Alphaproteobacteria bacterium]